MIADFKEAISALADGERGGDNSEALIDKIIHDPEARKTWERYHLIRDAIKERLPEKIPTTLAARVHDAIAAEPISLDARRKRPRLLKPIAGLALAASVATLAIVGVRSFDTGVAPVTQVATASRPTESSGNRWNVNPEVEARLNAYLVNHSEYVGYGMQGMMPYARIVGYDSAQ